MICAVFYKTKTKIHPLKRMGAVAPDGMIPVCSYKSELLTPKPKPYHHPPLEGSHPLQGDKQEINRFAGRVSRYWRAIILFKAINKKQTVSQGRVSRYWEGEKGLFLVYRLVVDAKPIG